MAGLNMRLDNEPKQRDARLADPGTTADITRALAAAKRAMRSAYDPDANTLECQPRKGRR